MLRNFIEKDLVSWIKVTFWMAVIYVIYCNAHTAFTIGMYAPVDVSLTAVNFNFFQVQYLLACFLHFYLFWFLLPRFLFRKFMGLVRKFSPAKA